jgi:hypothetical protein
VPLPLRPKDLNYAFNGRKEPDFPGGLIPNHALNGTGEWAYGITDWWEMGFYTPFAVDQNLTPYSNAAKIRQLFVFPNAAQREELSPNFGDGRDQAAAA